MISTDFTSATLVAALSLSLGGCGGGNSHSDRALPLAVFDVGSPTCASTGETPAYPAANYRAALFDFTALTSHTWRVGPRALIETIVDSDCELTVERGIFENDGSTFSRRKNRRHAFVPEGCELAVTFQERDWPVSPAYTTLFTDNDALDEDLVFEVSALEDDYRLETAATDVTKSLWKAYGCAESDRLDWRLSPAD